MLEPWLAFLAVVISIIALFFTFRRYLSKVGVKIRGGYGHAQTIESNCNYVYSVILENEKDRAISIKSIFLRLGNTCYLEIEDFENDPLILKAFESYTKNYDPVEEYVSGTQKVDINEMLGSPDVKKRLFLSTGAGKVKVKPLRRYWIPVMEALDNHAVAIVHANRMEHRGKGYGSNVRYVVDFHRKDGSTESVAITREKEDKKFRRFTIPKGEIESAQNIERHIKKLIVDEVVRAKTVEVTDLDILRSEIESDRSSSAEEKQAQVLGDYGWFRVNVLGRGATKLRSWELKRRNKRASKKRSASC